MALSYLLLALLLDNAMAVAMPEPTPLPNFEERQQALTRVYSPSLIGTTISYAPYTCSSGSALVTSSNYWKCCNTAVGCTHAASCVSGTVFFSATTAVCSSVYTDTAYSKCGTEYLYVSMGGTQSWKRIVCADPTDITTDFTYLVMPPSTTISGIITTPTTRSGSSSTTTTPPATSTPAKSSTPVGAIVGGVVGGLAVLAILAGAIFFILRKRSNPSPPPAPQAGYFAESGDQARGAMGDNKHASMMAASVGAASPPPMYQNTAAQYQPPYGFPDQGQTPLASPASYNYGTHPVPTPVPTASPQGTYPPQHQYGSPMVELPGGPS